MVRPTGSWYGARRALAVATRSEEEVRSATPRVPQVSLSYMGGRISQRRRLGRYHAQEWGIYLGKARRYAEVG
jgi:hypothetical protein